MLSLHGSEVNYARHILWYCLSACLATFVSLYVLCNKIGQKRKHMECDSMVGELSAVLEKAEERAAERELRMRKMELEMEAKMRERDLCRLLGLGFWAMGECCIACVAV